MSHSVGIGTCSNLLEWRISFSENRCPLFRDMRRTSLRATLDTYRGDEKTGANFNSGTARVGGAWVTSIAFCGFATVRDLTAPGVRGTVSKRRMSLSENQIPPSIWVRAGISGTCAGSQV